MGLVRPPRTARAISFLIVVCFLVYPLQAQYSADSGTANDPYHIATAADPIALGETPDDYEIPGVSLAEESINRRPSVPISSLVDQESLDTFRDIYEWYIEETFSDAVAR